MPETFHKYRLLGITLESNFPFSYPLLPGEGVPDLTLTLASEPPVAWRRSDWEPLYTSPYRGLFGDSILHFYRLEACDVLHFPGIADFFAWPERVECLPSPPVDYALIETFLFGGLLPYCMEARGAPVLHASSVAVDGGIAAFLANSGGGKSTLAAAMVKAGLPLVGDDILPIRKLEGQFLGYPSFPVLRLYDAQAQYLLGHSDGLPRLNDYVDKYLVSPGRDGVGSFCDTPLPLACLYLPERREASEAGASIEITPLSPQQALIELVRHTFGPRLVKAMGLAPQRFALLAEAARQVPMRRLSYPNGFEHLETVREAVLADLRSTELAGVTGG